MHTCHLQLRGHGFKVAFYVVVGCYFFNFKAKSPIYKKLLKGLCDYFFLNVCASYNNLYSLKPFFFYWNLKGDQEKELEMF